MTNFLILISLAFCISLWGYAESVKQRELSPFVSQCPPDNMTAEQPMFSVSDSPNASCILFNASIIIKLTYTNNNGNNVTVKRDISHFSPYVNMSSSHCGLNEQILTIQFGTAVLSQLTFSFSNQRNHTKTEDGKAFALYQISAVFNLADECLFPNAHNSSVNGQSNELTNYVVATNHSYSCGPESAININEKIEVTLANAQFEAFGQDLTVFDAAHLCPQQENTNDLVPIIVGAALAGLVVVVLIAYLVGRVRQKQSTGYESV